MNLLNKNIKAVGFDLDDTLYFPKRNDEIPRLFCEAIASVLQIPSKEVIDFYQKNIVQYGNSPQTARAFCNGRVSDTLLDTMFLDVLEGNEEIDLAQNDHRLYSLITDLATQYKIFLVTGNRKPHAIRKLNAIGLEVATFNATRYGAEDKTEGMRSIAAQLGVPLVSMMYTGDQEVPDISCAKALEMTTAKITSQHDYMTQADFQVRQVHDLRNILLGN